MRLFVAVYPPAAAQTEIAAQVARLRVGEAAARGINVRLADPATLHLTLAFLGDVAEERLPDVTTALRRSAERWRTLTGRTGPGEAPPLVRLGGGGRFGRGKFTILWAGLAGDVAAVRLLAETTRRELRRARLPHDWRPFRPHLTLARPGDRMDRAEVEADRQALDGYLGQVWPVTEMVLMRSHLGPRPSYDRLASWPV